MYIGRWLLRGIILSLTLFSGLLMCIGWYEITPHPPHELGDLLNNLLIVSAILSAMGWTFTLPLSISLDNRILNQMTRAVELLGKTGGPSCLGTLAAAYTHKPMRDAATTALALVAAKVRPADYGTLPGQTVPPLCGAVWPRPTTIPLWLFCMYLRLSETNAQSRP